MKTNEAKPGSMLPKAVGTTLTFAWKNQPIKVGEDPLVSKWNKIEYRHSLLYAHPHTINRCKN